MSSPLLLTVLFMLFELDMISVLQWSDSQLQGQFNELLSTGFRQSLKSFGTTLQASVWSITLPLQGFYGFECEDSWPPPVS